MAMWLIYVRDLIMQSLHGFGDLVSWHKTKHLLLVGVRDVARADAEKRQRDSHHNEPRLEFGNWQPMVECYWFHRWSYC